MAAISAREAGSASAAILVGRQGPVVDPHVPDRSAEPLGAAAGADAQRMLGRVLRPQPVEQHLDALRRAVDVERHPLDLPGAVVGRRDVQRAIEGDRRRGLHVPGVVVHPEAGVAAHEIELQLPVDEEQAEALSRGVSRSVRVMTGPVAAAGSIQAARVIARPPP